MYTPNEYFHEALANGNPQVAILTFSDAVFTNTDINVEEGIRFNEHFNMEKDISIGQALSSEIEFTLFNDARDLNNYEFGEFRAFLGVQSEDTYYSPMNRGVRAKVGSYTWAYSNNNQTLTLNNTAVSPQPVFQVTGIVLLDGYAYIFGTNNRYLVYTIDGQASQKTISAFAVKKGCTLDRKGVSFNLDGLSVKVETDYGERVQWYEIVPLGTFIADRPDSPDRIDVHLHCYDRMSKFDKDMPDKTTLGITYPTTIGTLFEKLCLYAEVPFRTSTFINSGAEIAKEPEEFGNATMRTVMGWIAEAAGSNAVFDRDGYLVMRWLTSTATVIDESGYAECVPVWYEVQPANKLHNRQTGSGTESTYGSGSRGYLIQDNPLLKNAT